MSIPVLVINRDVDTERLGFVMESAASYPCLTLERVPAVDGYAADFDVNTVFPGFFATHLDTPEQGSVRTLSAVFLSHLSCWKRIAARDEPFGLIVEDDVRFKPAISELESDLEGLGRFDMVFVNNRMIKFRRLCEQYLSAGRFMSLADAYKALSANLSDDEFENSANSETGVLRGPPGGDGYVLTREAAARLVDASSRIQDFLHVDYFLMMAGIGWNLLAELRNQPKRLTNLHRRNRNLDISLNAFIHESACVLTRPSLVGGSVRNVAHILSPQCRDRGPRAYIHLGFHKTGTTYLQALLAANRVFLNQGFLTIVQQSSEARELRGMFARLHGNNASEDDTKEARIASLNAIRRLSEQAVQTGRSLILSDEELSGMMLGRGGAKVAYRNIGLVAKIIAEGVEPLPCTFIVYTRDHEAWMKSAYNYNVTFHGMRRTYEEFLDRFQKIDHLAEALKTLQAEVGEERLVTIRYERDCLSQFGLGHGFLSTIGLTDQDLENIRIPDHANESLSATAVEFMRRANGLEMPQAMRRKLRNVLFDSTDLFA